MAEPPTPRPAGDAPPPGSAPAHGTLFVGLLLVSTSGPFLARAGMDAWDVVFLRTALAAPLFLSAAAARGALRPPPGEGGRIALGGVLLGTHFLLWVKAFDLTDFASNLLLLVAQPVIAAFLGARIGERATRRTWVAVALATAGLLLIAGGDFRLGPRALLGDLLSVLAGLAIALFYLVTRGARASMGMDAFMGWTMAAAALLALPVSLVGGRALGSYSAEAWGWVAALVAVTTMGGHGLMNAAARRLPLFTVNFVIVLEPPIGLLIGAALGVPFALTPVRTAGGLLLAAAVWAALLPVRRAATPPPVDTSLPSTGP